ncbi:hypothetical protein BV25DRAFT_1989702 [Artomyces pyxidatus]|uniref:Uncharacterized protein n=1 Tax=Artomyces pyxidatus TaxID=48021 RepID=A0ACB8T8Y6_9AGAM|nr:hypothetical protein BV25DRAFT_1989702 [Artomyces pyxidatus]
MFATLFSATLFSFLAVQVARADFSLSTPTFVQCQPVHLGWSNSSAGPYNVLIVPEADECGDALADLGDHTGLSLTWNVTLPAGKQILVTVEDSAGNEAWSQPITVQSSSDSSCLSAADRASLKSLSATPSGTSLLPTASVPVEPTDAVAPVGAANAGVNPLEATSGAFSIRQIYTPAMVLSALGAALAVAL